MIAEITELLGRADTGISVKPFICRCDEDLKMFVKSAGSLKSSLIAEWIGGRVAQLVGLPCADISIVMVPEELAEANRNPEWSDFKAGIGFGSYAMGNRYRDLQPSDISRLPQELLAEFYVFDYWLKNQDRIMTTIGGNPNALVSADVTELVAIDHDNGFDPDFSKTDFDQYHLGRLSVDYWRVSEHQTEWTKRASEAFSQLRRIWGEIPEEWVYSNLDMDGAPSYTVEHYETILKQPFEDSEAFWKGLLI